MMLLSLGDWIAKTEAESSFPHSCNSNLVLRD